MTGEIRLRMLGTPDKDDTLAQILFSRDILPAVNDHLKLLGSRRYSIADIALNVFPGHCLSPADILREITLFVD